MSLVLIFVWFWISDNKEKYPKTEMAVNSIIAIILMAPWFSVAIVLLPSWFISTITSIF